MKTISSLKYLMVLFLFTVMSCEKVFVENKTFKVNQESTFRINQLYTSTDGQYTLQINEISDSRCPLGVFCIQQGEVTLKGEWSANKIMSTFEVHSVFKNLDKQPDGFTIQIVDVKPIRIPSKEYKPEDYIITLLVQKNNTKLDTITFSHSMKGWELYSYPNGSDWNYSILMGTNREKTYQEVITNKIAVVGKDSLKMLMNKFPAKEEIFWIGKRLGDGWDNLSFPNTGTINETKDYCQQKELVLNVLE